MKAREKKKIRGKFVKRGEKCEREREREREMESRTTPNQLIKREELSKNKSETEKKIFRFFSHCFCLSPFEFDS